MSSMTDGVQLKSTFMPGPAYKCRHVAVPKTATNQIFGAAHSVGSLPFPSIYWQIIPETFPAIHD
jgi:hypothetical protein